MTTRGGDLVLYVLVPLAIAYLLAGVAVLIVWGYRQLARVRGRADTPSRFGPDPE
jgi:hypothetical protein